MGTDDRDAIEFRRTLRREATDAESRLWWLLRGRHLGAKFRRQHPVGPYVLDFYCAERRVAIELDGGQHWAPDEIERDARRTAYLAARGIRVVRFSNYELLGECDAALAVIWEAIGGDEAAASRSSRTPPSP